MFTRKQTRCECLVAGHDWNTVYQPRNAHMVLLTAAARDVQALDGGTRGGIDLLLDSANVVATVSNVFFEQLRAVARKHMGAFHDTWVTRGREVVAKVYIFSGGLGDLIMLPRVLAFERYNRKSLNTDQVGAKLTIRRCPAS